MHGWDQGQRKGRADAEIRCECERKYKNKRGGSLSCTGCKSRIKMMTHTGHTVAPVGAREWQVCTTESVDGI